MSRVLEDIRSDSVAARSLEGQSNGTGIGGKGASGDNGAAGGGGNGKVVGRGEGGQSLALPKNVVEEGVRITRECLEQVVEVIE
jgi:hypothetical protein